jgi:twinkle protein
MTVLEEFQKLGIVGLKEKPNQQKVLCPLCSPHRKKSTELCLSVNIDAGVANCKNCGKVYITESGDKNTLQESYVKKSFTIPRYDLQDTGLDDEVIDWFAKRGVSEATLKANYIGASEDRKGKLHIEFPFIKGDKVVNIKFRSMDKGFRLVAGAEKCFFGIQNLYTDGYLSTDKLYITEGEIDALSLYECGFRAALSVPMGASVEEEGSTPIIPKLEYLDDPDIWSIIGTVKEVVLVTDSDYKGKRLKEEIAKRIGKEKCSFVTYPEGCKDINDVLMQHGLEAVVDVVLKAEPMLQGIITVNSRDNELLTYYSEGLKSGLFSGIEAFDDLYTLDTGGRITLVTGVPEVKKSVMIDNITHGYANENDLHIAMFSPETRPVEFHIGRLASIHNGMKFGSPEDADRMPYQDFKEAKEWIDKHYVFLQPERNTIEEVLALAKLSVMKYGTKILVIDPYSKLRVDSDVEHKFIRNMLNDVSEFAARFNVHVFIVAHPYKVEMFSRGKGDGETKIKNYPPVTPYMIKGASEWYNSADFILSLWKNVEVEDSPLRVYCFKSKYFHMAKSNEYCELPYNFDNWRLGETLE